MTSKNECKICDGKGYLAVQICCGIPVVGAEYMGIYEEICCGNPDEEFEDCHECKGTGVINAPPAHP